MIWPCLACASGQFILAHLYRREAHPEGCRHHTVLATIWLAAAVVIGALRP